MNFRKFGNIIGSIGGYMIGFVLINLAIPNLGLKEWGFVTLGGCVIIATTLFFKD